MEKYTSIADLNIATKPRKALVTLGVNTVGDFLNVDLDNVLTIPGMGARTKNDLLNLKKRILRSLGKTEEYSSPNSCREWNAITEQFTVRTRNGLAKLGIESIQSFLALNREKVLSVRGVGVSSWNEIHKLQLDLVKQKHIDSSTVPECPEIDSRHQNVEPSWNNILKQMSVRTQHGLKKLGINTIEDFIVLTQERFLSVKAIGITCWKEVQTYQKQIRNELPSDFIYSQNKANRIMSNEEAIQLLMLVRDELGGRQHIIDDLKIHSFSELINVTREEVIALDHVGIVAWNKLQQAIQKVADACNKNRVEHDTQKITLECFTLFGGIGVNSNSIPRNFHPKTPARSLTLSPRNRAILKKLKIDTLESLLMISPDRLLKQKNFGESSLQLLRQSIRDYLHYKNDSDNLIIETVKTFKDFIRLLCTLSELSDREASIFTNRLVGAFGYISTLDYLANIHGFTRERVRQIILSCSRKIQRHYKSTIVLASFINHIRDILEKCRGIVSVAELGEHVRHSMKWDDKIFPDSIKEFIKQFVWDDEISLQNGNIVCEHPCRKCSCIVEGIAKAINSTPSGMISISSLPTGYSFCIQTSEEGCPPYTDMRYSHSFIAELAKRANLIYNCDNIIYTPNTWDLRRGGLNRKVEAVLFKLKRPASSDEVWKELCPYLESFISPERIHSALINADNAHVWGRAIFVHSSYIDIDKSILPLLNNILSLKLDNLSFVALYGLFYEYRVVLENAGIPNEYALSTIINLFLDGFHVDKYRYVYLNKPNKDASIAAYIEQWILDQDGEVNRSDLDRWMTEKVGIRKSLIQPSLARLNKIVMTRKDHLIHLDNTGITFQHLEPLFRWLKVALKEHGQVGVDKLYKSQRVVCSQLNIVSKNMLYGAIRYLFSDYFDFPQYPHVCRIDQSTFNTLGEAITDFFRKRSRIVSLEECFEYFGAKGYSPNRVQSRIYYLPVLLPYYSGCLIHEKTIGWDNNKKEQIRRVLRSAYISRLNLGYILGDLEDVYDRFGDQLPTLSNNICWTGELLSAIASQLSDVKLLGNAKRAYTLISYKNAVKTLSELVALIVRDHFGGGCSREQMNEWMRENGVIRKQLTPHMFTSMPCLEVNEHEYLWKGNINA